MRRLLVAAAVSGCGALPPLPPAATTAAASDVELALFLIGDAGGPDKNGEPVLIALQADVASRATDRLMVFLGDNVYPRGMPAEVDSTRRRDAERRALAQVRVAAQAGADAIFIPGNHDWDRSGIDGWSAIQRQEVFIEWAGNGRAEFIPDAACPGPVVRDRGPLRLILLDTEWWLRESGKPEHPHSDCPADSEAELIVALSAAIAGAANRHVVVAGHHPLASGGPHGGYFTVLEHIFPLREWKSWLWVPLPVLGSAYPIARKNGITNQDLSGPRNRAMRRALDSTFAVERPLVYAAGHEHGLQVLDGGSGARYLIVSGAGNFGHVSRIAVLGSTRFTAPGGSGYARLEFQRDGRVRLSVVVVDRTARSVEAFAIFIPESR
jgi:hypothetical protein